MFIPQGGLIIPLGYNFLLVFPISWEKISFSAFQFLQEWKNKTQRLFLRVVHVETPIIFKEFPREEPDPSPVGVNDSFLSAVKGFGAQHWTPYKLEAELS